jgi:DNA-binding HxlR family transcriptional regulator
MERAPFADMRCSIARTMAGIGDGWSSLILRDLFLGVARFDDLVEDLGISRNLLTRRLASLAKFGIVTRRPYQSRPARYEYGLTEAGLELVPVLVALSAWGDRWAPLPEGPPLFYVHARCGCRFTPRIRCSACDGELAAADIRAAPGPGGAATRGTRIVAQRLAERAADRTSRPTA